MNLPSILRHWLTLGLTALTVFLGAHLLAPDETKAFDEAAKQLVAPLVIIGTLVATAVWRMALTWIANIFRTGSGEPKDKTTRGPGEVLLWCVLGTAAALLMTTALPSCTSAQWDAARAVPIRIGIQGPDAALNYSSKSGLEVNAVIRATK